MSGTTIGFIIQIRSCYPSLSQGKRHKPDWTQHDATYDHLIRARLVMSTVTKCSLSKPKEGGISQSDTFESWGLSSKTDGAHHPNLPCAVKRVQIRLPRCQRTAGVWDTDTPESTGHTLKGGNHFRETQAAWLCEHLAGFSYLCHSLSKGQALGALSGHITPELPLCKFPMEIPSLH